MDFISNLIQCNGIEDLDFKSTNAYMNLSAAITSSGELYVCGQSNKIYTDQFLLIKNEFNLPMIIDKIELNNDKLFAVIGRVLEKET